MDVGDCVRLANPENPQHPRVGHMGEVIEVSDHPATTRRPARRLLWTRFYKTTWEDWRTGRRADEVYGLYEHELEFTEKGQ